jgi:hypothetical protein
VRHARPVAILSFATVVLSLPLILYGFPVLGHDGPRHLLYYRHFASQFWAGEGYPRWLMGTHHGFGSPVFFVYGPLPFYISSTFAPLAAWFPSKPPGYVELTLSAGLALWCSGLAAYLWLRRFCVETAAIVGALVYLASPYHVTVDLYMRAAFAEFWAFVWMPLILYFTEGVVRNRRYAVIGLALSYALLVMTHLLTTLMFSPVPIAYALFLSKTAERRIALARLATGMALGIGLASVYFLPAMEHERHVSPSDFLLDPVYQWQRNFPPLDARLFQVEGSWPAFVQFVAVVVILFLLALACLTVIVRGAAGVFWVSAAGASLFMMLPISTPVWRLLPILAKLQFPWRFLTVLTVAIAALAALSFGEPWPSISRKAAAAGLSSIILLWLAFFGQMSYVISRQDHQRAWTGEFSDDPFFGDSTRVTKTPMPQVRFESGAGDAKIEKWAPRDIRVRLRCDRDSSLLFHQFYYPGWRASVTAPVEASGQGLIRVKAPAGEYELRLWLDGGSMERIGAWVSAVSAAIVLLFARLRRFA